MALPTATRRHEPRRTASRVLRAPPGERFNVATAVLGLVAALVAGAWLLARAEGARAVGAFALYAGGVCLLFVATALHHLRPESELLCRLDHASIYVAIAGTSAPVCLLLTPDAVGLACFGGIALLAGAGAVMKMTAPLASPARNLWLYVPVPLPTLAAVSRAWHALPSAALLTLGAALAAFAAGAVVDARERPSPPRIGAHGVFHVLVLVGSALAFVFLAAWVPARG